MGPAAAAEPGCPAAPHAHVPEATAPLNLGELKLQLIDYKCFGEYDRAVARVLMQAQAFIRERAKHESKLALVLDIDETSLSNWPELVANDFGYIPDGDCNALPKGPCGSAKWELRAEAKAIEPTRDLFNAAKAAGVAVFFITGRKKTDEEVEATVKNLTNEGYTGWSGLELRPIDQYKSVSEFKTAKRAEIEGKGFTIIANIGDQWSDLDGGHAERIFRVPNPFYYIP